MNIAENRLLTGAVLGGFIAVGLIWSGSYLHSVGKLWQESTRIASVKGVAEQEQKADMAIWPLNFRVEANDLAELQNELQKSEALTRGFLHKQGFQEAELTISPIQVRDRNDEYYSEKHFDNRYTASATVVVRTSKVENVRTASRQTGDLVSQGVLLTANEGYDAEYQFTHLNDIKPEMIHQATASARKAAEQFASDSGSRLGSIKTASQGYFSVEDLDRYTPNIKKIRVVTNIDYTLKD